jgi:hypothetical protein
VNSERGISEANSPRHTARGKFLGSALLIAVIMFLGFSRNYYLRHWLGTRDLSLAAYLHGLIMTMWVLLFLTQTFLISRRRLALHRVLGTAGAGLAVVVVIFGCYTILADIARQSPGADLRVQWETFVAFDGISLLVFGGVVATALYLRKRLEIHRRLMLVAMIALLPPAFGRLVANVTHQHVEVAVLFLMFVSVVSFAAFDAMRHGRLHPAVLWGGAAVLISNVLTYRAQVG